MPPQSLYDSKHYENLLTLQGLQSWQPEQIARYKTENIIVVDMGSTGSRMHAYNIQMSSDQPENDIPFLTEIAIAKNQDKHAIADYCSNPKKVSEHILPIYYDLSKQLKNLNIDIEQVPIYFYATAGMRLHDKRAQTEVYKYLQKAIVLTGHSPNKIITKTISGELEGIFDWLSINYKLQTIQNDEPTIAALDMGGASTQVAMEYTNKNKEENQELSSNLFLLNFADKKYTIYSNSILGYGLTQTKKNITNYDHKQAIEECSITEQHHDSYKHNLGHDINKTDPNFNPVEDSEIKNFNYLKCSNLIKLYLQNKKEHLNIAKAIKSAIKTNMKFVAASGYYYNFNFFNSKLPEDLIKTIPDSCHTHRAKFKRKFNNISEAQLNEACFDATYLKILLNSGYKLPEGYNNFLIPKHDIDWTIGAALFISTKQKINA
ncbi:MAG: hypothetical protein KBD64_06210 [Gammaproteobacteria bacterium]|nr:hypothetical protein [Gammaproteobacteria bacterium]